MVMGTLVIGSVFDELSALGTHDTPATLTTEPGTSLRPYSVLEHC